MALIKLRSFPKVCVRSGPDPNRNRRQNHWGASPCPEPCRSQCSPDGCTSPACEKAGERYEQAMIAVTGLPSSTHGLHLWGKSSSSNLLQRLSSNREPRPRSSSTGARGWVNIREYRASSRTSFALSAGMGSCNQQQIIVISTSSRSWRYHRRILSPCRLPHRPYRR